MPLAATFSRIRPARSTTSSASPANNIDVTTSSSPPMTLKKINRSQSVRGPQQKDRLSKAFTTFSFDIIGSFRGRHKTASRSSNKTLGRLPLPVENVSTRSLTLMCESVNYPGYEDDEEYGIEEEIRRPSGLGSPASAGEFRKDFSNKLEGRISEETYDSDTESLVEIRPPSGLGNIKVTIQDADLRRQKSTYPNFYIELFRGSRPRHKKGSFSVTSSAAPSPNFSAMLMNILPMLSSYLDRLTLTALSLVDRGLNKHTNKLLWRNVQVSLKVSHQGLGVDGRLPAGIKSMLSSSREVASLVENLELCCKVDSSSPFRLSSSPRSRPPPLVLLPNHPSSSNATATRTGETLIISGPFLVTTPGTPPLPPPPEPEPISLPRPSTDKLAPTHHRRPSLLSRTKSLNLGVPEALKASAAKFSRRLSYRVLRPQQAPEDHATVIEALSPSRSLNSSRASTPNRPFHLPSRYQESGSSDGSSPNLWVAPMEWARVNNNGGQLSVASEQVQAPAPSTWTKLKRTPSAATKRLSRHTPSLSSLQLFGRSGSRDDPQASMQPSEPEKKSHRELRQSPSLPMLRSPTFASLIQNSTLPSVAGSPITLENKNASQINIAPLTPMTPMTPQSAISLSAFPLPPPTVSLSPRSIGSAGLGLGMPKEYMFEPEEGRKLSKEEPEPQGFDEGILVSEEVKGLIKGLVNVEKVKIVYQHAENEVDSSPTLTIRTNQSLADLLRDSHSLERLTIVCPPTHVQTCQAQWTDLTASHSLKYLQVVVDSA